MNLPVYTKNCYTAYYGRFAKLISKTLINIILTTDVHRARHSHFWGRTDRMIDKMIDSRLDTAITNPSHHSLLFIKTSAPFLSVSEKTV